MRLFFAIISVFGAINASRRHSEYASRVDPTKKFLPRSFFNKHETKLPGDVQELECKVRQYALEYANDIQSFRDQSATADALNLDSYCSTTKTKSNADHKHQSMYRSNPKLLDADSPYTVYVDPINGNDHNSGSINAPFLSIDAALSVLRSFCSNEVTKQIIIRQGTVYLNSTIQLSPATFDNNLLIRSYPHENVTISGGILLKIDSFKWERYNDGNASHNIWKAVLDEPLVKRLFNNTILSLFTESPHTRLTRARYPNGHVEVWNDGAYYLNPYFVNKWTLTPSGDQFKPHQVFKNLSDCSDITQPCLNKSHDKPFDTYTAGYGNFCDLWTPSYSYWCGANVFGGWAEQDGRMAREGIRQLPTGMVYNTSQLPEISAFGDDISTAIFYIHHSQGWNTYWWEIGSSYDLNTGEISFGQGGSQGGRVWTKTHDLNRNAVTNLPIMGGPWYIENIFSALDSPGEWFFDTKHSTLYYWPNNTQTGESPTDTHLDLVIGNLAHLFELTSDDMHNPLMNVTFMDFLFRDTRYTYLDEWGTPSGGDWALYNGGAFYFENTADCAITSSSFQRLDGNCIALYGYNRNTTFKRNDFGWIGDNVIGAWGKTKDFDGTDGQQPRYTNIIENYVHDIGLYQLQSSLFFSGKSCLNTLYGNIVYNIPRAAILFNDAFGGGTNVSRNLIFNTCTQSGDHGPINSWNRMPFLTNVAYGYPSFDSQYNNIKSNFVFANYGGSQSFDTDDGSAWHNIESNFFYDAQAYKNDYGGYNVKYINNMNVALGGDAHNSWGIGSVNDDGPGNTIYGNKIIVFQCGRNTASCDTNGQIWGEGNLNGKGVLTLHDNDYYTPNGNASILTDSPHNLTEMYNKYGLCKGSSANTVPSVDQIITWAKEILA